MFDHVTIRASDRAASERFYDTVLGTLGIGRTSTGESYTEWGDFTLAQATDERPVTRRLHMGFVAPSREDAGAFWRAGTEAGHADDGPPGPRPEYGPDYYGAFLLDPDGNSAEAVHHGSLRADGTIDHLWVRVADVGASARCARRRHRRGLPPRGRGRRLPRRGRARRATRVLRRLPRGLRAGP
jgi:catechol 2,3-dioxygenase-like lactoylglutathione lyase family enzyme